MWRWVIGGIAPEIFPVRQGLLWFLESMVSVLQINPLTEIQVLAVEVVHVAQCHQQSCRCTRGHKVRLLGVLDRMESRCLEALKRREDAGYGLGWRDGGMVLVVGRNKDNRVGGCIWRRWRTREGGPCKIHIHCFQPNTRVHSSSTPSTSKPHSPKQWGYDTIFFCSRGNINANDVGRGKGLIRRSYTSRQNGGDVNTRQAQLQVTSKSKYMSSSSVSRTLFSFHTPYSILLISLVHAGQLSDLRLKNRVDYQDQLIDWLVAWTSDGRYVIGASPPYLPSHL